ncbi:MAG: type 4a pilus biogenesis protein PilO [bacterium]|nr:type 4a pilus biogenesis protein PilO [bacterium]
MMKNFISILFIVGGVVLFWFWTKPLLNDIDGLVSKKETIDKALADSRQMQEMRQSILDKYNAISEEDLSRLSKMLPEKQIIANLILEVENVAKNSGTVFKNFDSSKVANEEKTQSAVKYEYAGGETSSAANNKTQKMYSKVAFGVSVSASYENFIVFLKELENSLHMIDVNSISFSSGDKNFYEFKIDADTYFKK